jgi:dephospho-CoA kinase
MILIGLTGTIGSGKSAVAKMLADLGADVIDTDEIAREVVTPGSKCLETIVAEWGPGILNPDGSLNRDKLARIVFRDEARRKKLNSILHPLIIAETHKKLAETKAAAAVLVVPLLFESGMDKIVNQRWVVAAPEEELVRRICARDGCDPEHARDRIRSQMSQEEKIARADAVIDNGGSLERTRAAVEEAWNRLEKL